MLLSCNGLVAPALTTVTLACRLLTIVWNDNVLALMPWMACSSGRYQDTPLVPRDPIMRRPCANREEKQMTYGSSLSVATRNDERLDAQSSGFSDAH